MNVGFIGLGNLGLPLAVNTVRCGHRTKGFDIHPERLEAFLDHGGAAAGSIAEAAEFGEVVVTVLPDAPDVETVALGRDGILDSLAGDSVYVDMSTIDPHTTRRVGSEFAERGMEMIDAPVARTLKMAWEGKSLLMLGGNPAAIERARPVLNAVSELSIYCGPLGNGSATKLTNNFLANGILAVAVEALGIGLKSGLSLETILETVRKTGTFNNMMLETLPCACLPGRIRSGVSKRTRPQGSAACMQPRGFWRSTTAFRAPAGTATLEILSELVASPSGSRLFLPFSSTARGSGRVRRRRLTGSHD